MVGYTKLLALAGTAVAQDPGHGVAKTTYACFEPFKAMSWLLKYLPVTATEDSCAANTCSDPGISQGRVQIVTTGYLRGKKCDLLSAVGADSSSASNEAAVLAPESSAAEDGPDCTFSENQAYANGTALSGARRPCRSVAPLGSRRARTTS